MLTLKHSTQIHVVDQTTLFNRKAYIKAQKYLKGTAVRVPVFFHHTRVVASSDISFIFSVVKGYRTSNQIDIPVTGLILRTATWRLC
jgi:hypothetical protein